MAMKPNAERQAVSESTRAIRRCSVELPERRRISTKKMIAKIASGK
jgi:hypothetical protein